MYMYVHIYVGHNIEIVKFEA